MSGRVWSGSVRVRLVEFGLYTSSRPISLYQSRFYHRMLLNLIAYERRRKYRNRSFQKMNFSEGKDQSHHDENCRAIEKTTVSVNHQNVMEQQCAAVKQRHAYRQQLLYNLPSSKEKNRPLEVTVTMTLQFDAFWVQISTHFKENYLNVLCSHFTQYYSNYYRLDWRPIM